MIETGPRLSPKSMVSWRFKKIFLFLFGWWSQTMCRGKCFCWICGYVSVLNYRTTKGVHGVDLMKFQEKVIFASYFQFVSSLSQRICLDFAVLWKKRICCSIYGLVGGKKRSSVIKCLLVYLSAVYSKQLGINLCDLLSLWLSF